jgi:hypothetical protein
MILHHTSVMLTTIVPNTDLNGIQHDYKMETKNIVNPMLMQKQVSDNYFGKMTYFQWIFDEKLLSIKTQESLSLTAAVRFGMGEANITCWTKQLELQPVDMNLRQRLIPTPLTSMARMNTKTVDFKGGNS